MLLGILFGIFLMLIAFCCEAEQFLLKQRSNFQQISSDWQAAIDRRDWAACVLYEKRALAATASLSNAFKPWRWLDPLP